MQHRVGRTRRHRQTAPVCHARGSQPRVAGGLHPRERITPPPNQTAMLFDACLAVPARRHPRPPVGRRMGSVICGSEAVAQRGGRRYPPCVCGQEFKYMNGNAVQAGMSFYTAGRQAVTSSQTPWMGVTRRTGTRAAASSACASRQTSPPVTVSSPPAPNGGPGVPSAQSRARQVPQGRTAGR